MREYNVEQYRKLVENSNNKLLKAFIQDERNFLIDFFTDNQERSIIDLGAGYGRIIPDIIRFNNSYYGIEINPDMFRGLNTNISNYSNAYALNEDFINLNEIILQKRIINTKLTLLLLQNTIGTIEGQLEDLLTAINKTLKTPNSNLIVSFFKKSSLKKQGIEMFETLTEMVGNFSEVDSNLDQGVFRTTTGYEAKWWTRKEITTIIDALNAEIISFVESDSYYIINLKRKK